MTVINKYDPTDEEMAFAMSSLPFTPNDRKVSKAPSKYEASDEDLEFAQGALQEPITEEVPWYKSYSSAAAKGFSRFVAGAAESVRSRLAPGNFEGDISEYFLPSEQKKKIAEMATPYSEEEREKLEEDLKKKFPANEGAIETGIEKATEIIPSALLSSESLKAKAIRTGAAAGLGTIAKQAGVGETGQSLIQMIPFLMPSLSKNLVAKNAAEQELIDFGRKHNIGEQELSLGLKDENWWNKLLSKAAFKGNKTKKALAKSKKAFGNVYDSLQNSPEAFKRMDKQYIPAMLNEYERAFKNTPNSVREKIVPAFEQFINSKGTGEDLIRFYQHANKDAGKEVKNIFRIQNVTKKAIKQTDPILGKEFELLNKLYENRSNLASRLKPPNIHSAQVAKTTGFFYGLLTGDFRIFSAALKALGIQHAATELLINPRFHNPLQKTIKALDQGKIHLAKESIRTLTSEFKEVYPGIEKFVNEESFDDYVDDHFKKSSNHQKESK